MFSPGGAAKLRPCSEDISFFYSVLPMRRYAVVLTSINLFFAEGKVCRSVNVSCLRLYLLVP
jgi:hypothetical protein